jgi:hypothetical protein
MELDDIIRWRMHNQHLWGPPIEQPDNVVRWLVAMQAQEFGPAKWSVAQRCDGVGNAALERAYADGAILRTHILRPTWHFVAPADLRWLMQLSGPRVRALNAYVDRRLELDDETIGRTNTLLARAVESGRHLTRTEIAARLQDAGIPASGQRLAYIVMRAELDSIVCSGAPRGKQHTYALFDERVPPGPAIDRDEALAELTGRYFASRGPATLKDFLRWSSLTVADGRRGLELAVGRLEHAVVGDRSYWFAASFSGQFSNPAWPVVNLVQIYDEYVMGYSESRDLIQRAGGTLDLYQGPVPSLHAILLDGQVIGHWRAVMSSRSVAIETQLARSLDDAEARALAEAVDRYGRFMDCPVNLISGS